MYENILVGWDGGDEAADALALAGALRAPGASVSRYEAPEPFPARGLLATVEELTPDLVVVGSSRQAAPGYARAGCVGRRLIEAAPCTVAIAPRGFREVERPVTTICVALDSGHGASATASESAALAARAGADVRLLCVMPPLERWARAAGRLEGYSEGGVSAYRHGQYSHILEEATDAFPEDVRVDCRLVDSGPLEASLARAETGADLIVIGAGGRGTVRRAVLGPDAAHAHEAPCAVLVVPATQAVASAH